MSVEPHLLPTHSEAIFNAMQAERTVLALRLTLALRIPATFFTARCQSSLKMWSWCLDRLP